MIKLAGALLLLPLAGLWHSMVTRKNRGHGAGIVTVPLSEVPEGTSLVQGCVLCKSGDSLKVFSGRCTHLGCPLRLSESGRLSCPCHGSEFEPDQGQPLRGPALRPLETYDFTVEDDRIVIRVNS